LKYPKKLLEIIKIYFYFPEMNGGPTATFGVASKQQLAMGSGPNRRRKQGCCSVL